MMERYGHCLPVLLCEIIRPVHIPVSRSYTERPSEASLHPSPSRAVVSLSGADTFKIVTKVHQEHP